jgi:hypothetical protein
VTTKDYVDALAGGMNWIEPLPDKSQPIVTEVVVKHLGGYNYECVAKTSNMGEFPVEVPYPKTFPTNALYSWAYQLSDVEILAGAQVFFDIWTWHDSSERYRELMDIFASVAKAKLSKSPNPYHAGDSRYDPNDDNVYCYDGSQWIQIGGSGKS